MKTATIRETQHGLAGLIAQVERGAEIIITRRNRPVARLLPIAADAQPVANPATLRAYWKNRPAPPAVRSTLTHSDLIAAGRGDL